MIVDAHTDVLLEVVVQGGQEPSHELVLRCGEAGVFKRYWLPRLVAGDVGVQIRTRPPESWRLALERNWRDHSKRTRVELP